MRHALPSNSNGSRILFTTRNDAIATSCKETISDFVLKLRPLSLELAWQLFCKKAFRYELEGHCPPELEHLSLEIVTKCKGLPLVVATVAALLSTKEKVVLEWQKLHDSLKSGIGNNPHLSNISKILSLSYDDLPHHLKSCILYFAIFPEDYYIDNLRLYRLWIAEGFVQEKRDKTLDQVADEYLNELIHRNLIQTRVDCYTTIRLCGVHDLVREIILPWADELSFCQCLGQHREKTSWGNYRRLSINNSTEHVLENAVEDFRGVRSILFFNIDKLEDDVILFEKFKLLKVLDFTNAPLHDLPKQVGKLLHLKYLCLKNTKIKMLPKSIGKLHNLQTLDIRDTCVGDLPIEISKLRNLQCILAYTYCQDYGPAIELVRGVKINKGFGCLENLRTLVVVDAYGSGIGVIKELEKLRHLRWLGISNLSAENGVTLCAVIEKIDRLELLHLNSISKDEYLDVQHISSPPRLLWQLALIGRLEKLPGWIAMVQNLSRLSLIFSRLADDPLKYLKDLPNLEILDTYQAYEGEQLHFKGGFRKLKQLSLQNLEGLKLLKIEGGALPLLNTLFIGPSPLLEEVPLDIHQRLRKLEVLKFFDMPKDFVLRMQPGGKDYWKVKHFGCVIFGYRRTEQQYKYYGDGESDAQIQNYHKYYKLGESDLLEYLQNSTV